MNYSAEKVVEGLMNYADSEIMGKLPTSGKWIMGTGIVLAKNKISDTIEMLQDNPIVKMLGIIDEDGNIDVDALIMAMKSSAERYGKLKLDVPLIGQLTFSDTDIDRLKGYII